MSEKPNNLPSPDAQHEAIAAESPLVADNYYDAEYDSGYAALDSMPTMIDTPLENGKTIKEMHLGHQAILGHGQVDTGLALTDDLLKADALRQRPDLRPAEWSDTGSNSDEKATNLYNMVAEDNDAYTKGAAYATREILRQQFMSDQNKELFDQYMEKNAPDFMRNLKSQKPGNGWSEWMAGGTTDEQLINFLQWHNYHMAERQRDPEVQAQISKQKEMYKWFITKAVWAGELPESAMQAAENIDNVEVRVGDVFDTFMRNWTGYHREGRVTIEESGISEAATHEFNHAVLGRLPYRWLNEAMTEHLAKSMKYGDFMKVDAKGTKYGGYIPERELMGLVVSLASNNTKPGMSYEDNMTALIDEYVTMDGVNLHKIDENLGRVFHVADTMTHSPLAMIDAKIDEYYEQFKQEPGGDRMAMIRAIQTVRSDFLQQPQVVFGKRELATV